MTKTFRLLLITMITLIIGACSDDTREVVHFVGDSLIARWNVSKKFPDYKTYNDGQNGATIDYIEGLAGNYNGTTTVVLIGTNDIYNNLRDADLEPYTDRYMAAIMALGAEKIYLLSVPPRTPTQNFPEINDVIDRFNAIIREKAAAHQEIIYVDIHDALMKDGTLNAAYTTDGLHLNKKGYDIITSILSPYITD